MTRKFGSEEPDIDEFLEESNAIEREYSEEALEDAKEAWDYAYKNRKEITVEYVLEIHRLLAIRLRPDIAGKVRTCAVYIGYEKKEQKPEKVLLKEIQDWIDNCKLKKKKSTENEIKNFHINFEKIHPHEDFNGRTGRILWQIQRVLNGHKIKIIHTGFEQNSYYGWFK